MKKLSKLSLAHLSEQELSSKQLKEVKGGDGSRVCYSACYYADQGGSSIEDNCRANYVLGASGGYSKPGDNIHYCLP